MLSVKFTVQLQCEIDITVRHQPAIHTHRQTTLRMGERVTSRYFETVVTADSTDPGKFPIQTSNRRASLNSPASRVSRQLQLSQNNVTSRALVCLNTVK